MVKKIIHAQNQKNQKASAPQFFYLFAAQSSGICKFIGQISVFLPVSVIS